MKPKLLEINNKSNQPTLFGVRYSRLLSFACEIIEYANSEGRDFVVERSYKIKQEGDHDKPVANAPLDIEKISNSLKGDK